MYFVTLLNFELSNVLWIKYSCWVLPFESLVSEVCFYVDTGPNGRDVPTHITETSAGSFRVEYTPVMAGK